MNYSFDFSTLRPDSLRLVAFTPHSSFANIISMCLRGIYARGGRRKSPAGIGRTLGCPTLCGYQAGLGLVNFNCLSERWG